ncbi:hypothetical protein GCM10022214_43960 [Actinomadura miaoliensis]|uniref:Uncharacterized protein n=1 Tax=Actinomadura miaoliensis TaxID=430685 RepID=A0ABP7W5Y4_9ACTN
MDEYVQVVNVLLELSRCWAFGTSRATVARGTLPHGGGSEVIGWAVSGDGDADARDRDAEGEDEGDDGDDVAVDVAPGSVTDPRSSSGGDDVDAARSPSSPPGARTNTAPAASANATSATTTASRRGRRPDGGSGAE